MLYYTVMLLLRCASIFYLSHLRFFFFLSLESVLDHVILIPVVFSP